MKEYIAELIRANKALKETVADLVQVNIELLDRIDALNAELGWHPAETDESTVSPEEMEARKKWVAVPRWVEHE
jgi:hypothetical protein